MHNEHIISYIMHNTHYFGFGLEACLSTDLHLTPAAESMVADKKIVFCLKMKMLCKYPSPLMAEQRLNSTVKQNGRIP